MMDLTPFAQGLGAGIAVCVAIGPIAILILRRTMADGRLAGLVSGFGAATADAIIGAIGALFLSWILPILDAHNTAVQFVGGGVVISMGIFLLCTPPRIKEVKRPVHERNLIVAYFSTCVLTLSNPITLFSMTTIIAATGMGGPDTNHMHAAMLVSGIFVASMGWWVLLCMCAHTVSRLLGHGFLRRLNMIAAIIVIIFGVCMVVNQAQKKLYQAQRHHASPPPEQVAPVDGQ
ncbi:LysE family translocator [Ereboglobus luteus]|uniref:Lysine transporter LysE n=1 Tax=Ereboglobus luteus TaxID=1796921 RepID=A0A2U8E514_9BACT|nr:LysE family transporter [Ereboglobus luteus]AWI09947.1 hypothetical protein CKA38_12440 [Ereboglobus luteus]